jgi:hypothetical protein
MWQLLITYSTGATGALHASHVVLAKLLQSFCIFLQRQFVSHTVAVDL